MLLSTREGRPERIGGRERGNAHQDVGLLDRAVRDRQGRAALDDGVCGHATLHRAGLDREIPAGDAQGALNGVDDRVVVDRPRDGDHEILRAVVCAVVADHGVAGDRPDRRGVTADRAAKRVRAHHRLEEPLARDIRRIVVGHRQFFENHAAFVLEVGRIDQRRREHVCEHIDRHQQVTVAHLGVVAGVLLGRHRVVLAADSVEADGDVEGAARRRSLEQQVLEEVRRPVRGGLFVARTDRNPVADGGAAGSGDLLTQNPYAARQNASSNERVSGCGERQFGQVKGESDGAVHRPPA